MTLELFAKHPEADAYRVGGAYQPYAIVAVDKRFTDAELAAELHAMECEWRSLLHSGYYAGTELNHCEVLYRFATRPHYDE